MVQHVGGHKVRDAKDVVVLMCRLFLDQLDPIVIIKFHVSCIMFIVIVTMWKNDSMKEVVMVKIMTMRMVEMDFGMVVVEEEQ